MKNYMTVEGKVLKATMRTAAISELGEECAVFVEKHSVASRCFRCEGNIFNKLDNTNEVACSYCHTIYQLTSDM
jgi:Zn finger protein HypA/HybF involved in hydrogenase expression